MYKQTIIVNAYFVTECIEPISYLVNSYFYNYKPSPRIRREHRVLRNLRQNKDIVITKPDKGNGIAILDRKILQ